MIIIRGDVSHCGLGEDFREADQFSLQGSDCLIFGYNGDRQLAETTFSLDFSALLLSQSCRFPDCQ